MQRYSHANLPERFLAEVASKYVQQSQAGKNMEEKYSGFVNVVGLILLDEIDLDRVHKPLIANYVFMDTNNHYLYPAEAMMSMNVIKLDQRLQEKNQKIYYWAHFLMTGEILAASPKYIKEAYQMLEAKKWTDEELEIQRFANKAKIIGRGIKQLAYGEGKVIGLKEGAQGKAIEVAKNFLNMGLSLEQISKGTGLSIDKIKQLQD
jgi:predicted transposase/invertase (TIGR01784 family)